MKRRTFLKVTAAAGGGGVLLAALGSQVFGPSKAEVVEEVVRRYIGDQNLAPGAAARYAKDFVREHHGGASYETGLKLFFHLYELWRNQFPWPNVLPAKIDRYFDYYERRIITFFIQSSGIAGPPDQLKQPIDYVGYSERPNCNPFARLRS